VGIKVFQGEREMAADNKMLGACAGCGWRELGGRAREGGSNNAPPSSSSACSSHPPPTPPPPSSVCLRAAGNFDLVGIPPAPRGVPQVEVIFDIDANGIVHVTAKDKGTGKEQSISIQSSGGLSEGEIEKVRARRGLLWEGGASRCAFACYPRSMTPPPHHRPPQMVRAAEEFAVADKKKKEFIEAKNDGDSLVYSTEKSLSEHKAKLSAEDITAIEAALADTRKALGTEDVDALKASTQALQTAAMRIGTAMYKGAGGASSSGSAEGEPKQQQGADGGETKEGSFKDKSN